MDAKKKPRRKQQRPPDQTWWRFSEYEVRDGYILPAAGAQLSASRPWDGYWDREKKRDDQPPYQSLAALLDKFEVSDGGEPLLTQGAIDAVLSWVNDYGLLGVLLQESRTVFFEPMVRMDCGDLSPAAPMVPTWTLGHYFREPDHWSVHREFYSPTYGHYSDAELERAIDHFPSSPASDEKPGSRVPREWPGPHVLKRDLRTSQWFRRPLADSWFPYFPGSDHTLPTPRPLSDEFWKVYAEPFEEFVRAAVLLRMVFEWHKDPLPLPAKGRKGPRFAPAPDVPTRRRFPSLGMYEHPPDLFERLLDGVSPTVTTTISGGIQTHRQAWNAPSLLGMLAAMLMQDLIGGRGLKSCSKCGGPFVMGDHQTDYCSENCRWIANKRRHRAKAKALKLQAEGLSPRRIVKELAAHADPAVVKEWIKKAPPAKRQPTQKKTRRKPR